MKNNFLNKSYNKEAGMTLIELLIVIVIIGVMSTIVLSAISSSREKGYDSQVKQQLVQFRNAAEIYFYNQNPDSYGTANSCTEPNTVFTDVDVNNGKPGLVINASNFPEGTNIVCGSNGRSFSIKANLYDGNSYYCIDSKGTSKVYAGSMGVSQPTCP